MRTLSALVTALSLGGCATQPPSIADMVQHVRSAFDPGQQSCSSPSSITHGQAHLAQAQCFTENPAAQSKPSVLAAQAHTSQQIVDAGPGVFNTRGQASPRIDGDEIAVAILTSVPTLDVEASCHSAESLGADRNVNLCLAVESSAREQLVQKWTKFPSADRSHCARYTTAGSGGTYTDLLTCLEMEVDVKTLHAKNISTANQ
jgi:hypothetical protein